MIRVAVWDGNFCAVIAILALHNDQLRVRQVGKKLNIKDTDLSWFCSIPIGDPVMIPNYYEYDASGTICQAARIQPELREWRILCDENLGMDDAMDTDEPEDATTETS